MSDHIGKPNGMTDHLGGTNKMVCPHCGLPFVREQNGIQGYRCGSSYCESFKPQWARSMTCLELQNGQLQERIKRLEEAGDGLLHCTQNQNVRKSRYFVEWTAAKEAKS